MDLKSALGFLEQNQMSMLDLTIKLSDINSGSFNVPGINKVAEILKQEMATLNCEHVSMPVSTHKVINEKGEIQEFPLGNVQRFWKRPDAPMQVLLVGHMDSVYGPEHKFQRTSLTGGDILNGPGVADMKGGLVIMLWALKAFEQLPQASTLGWEVILTADEEIGSPGSSEIIESRAHKFKVGLVFEPSMDEKGTLAGSRKGSGNFTFIMRGKSAHAGRNFSEGRNAICKIAEIITKIDALNGQREGVTINVGFIHGGEAVNVVPDCCVCKLDVRVPHNNDADWVQHHLNVIVQTFNTSSGYKLELYGGFRRKPKVLDAPMEKLYNLVQAAGKEIGQNITWLPSGGCSDGNNLAAVGLPNVDTLGVRGGRIHSEQEYMLVPSLVERAQLVTNILVSLSENGF